MIETHCVKYSNWVRYPSFSRHSEHNQSINMSILEEAKQLVLATGYTEDHPDYPACLREEINILREERQRERDREEKEREHERHMERLKFQRDHPDVVSNCSNSTATNLAVFDPTIPRLPALKPLDLKSEGIDDFFRRLEERVTRSNWSDEVRLAQLLALLPRDEEKRLQQMPPTDRSDYEKIKKFLLTAHHINPAKRREAFKSLFPTEEDPGTWFPSELRRTLDLWLEAAEVPNTVEDIKNFLVMDQLYATLPLYLHVQLKEKCVKGPIAAGEVLKCYFEARPHSTLYKACKGLKDNNSRKNEVGNSNGSRYGTNTSSVSSSSSTGSSHSHRSGYRRDNGNSSSTFSYSNSSRPSNWSSRYQGQSSHGFRNGPATPNSNIQDSRYAPTNNTGSSNGRADSDQRSPYRPPYHNRLPNGQDGPSTSREGPGCSTHGPQAHHTDRECRNIPSRNSWRTGNNQPAHPSRGSSPHRLHLLTTEPELEGNSIQTPIETTQSEDDIPPVHCQHISANLNRASLKIVPGSLNGQNVQVLLDCGADTIFVAKKLVSPDAYTGQTMRVRTATSIVPGCPLAQVNFDCPYFVGGTTHCVILEDPPYDVILGRVRGTSSFEEDPPAVLNRPLQPHLQDEENTEVAQCEEPTINADSTVKCQVTTRAQQRLEDLKTQDPPTSSPIKDLPTLPHAEKFGQDQRECATLQKLRLRENRGKEVTEKGGGLSQIVIEDGLFYQKTLRNGSANLQLLVPLKHRAELLSLAHENPLSGHFAATKTRERIERDFWWPNLPADVKMHCDSCTTCAMARPRRPAKAPMGTPVLATEPFSSVSVDIVGPILPASAQGHRYILTVVDQATRYPDAVPLRHIDSATVADALISVFSHVGYPRQLTSDNGTQFTSAMFTKFLELLGTQHHRTPVYHAQSNGLVERFNGTLKNVLKKLTADRPRDWHRYLPILLFAYRDACQASTGFSPFELVFGHRVRGPLTFLKECWTSQEAATEEEREVHEYLHEFKNRLRETCALAHDNLAKAHLRQKQVFDKKSRMRTLKPGDSVLIFLPTSKKKLMMKWQGPHKVISRLGAYTYKVDVKRTNQIYHINLLRKFNTRDAIPEDCTEDPDGPVEAPSTTQEEVEEKTEGSTHILDTETDVYAAIAVAFEAPEDIALDSSTPEVPYNEEETIDKCILGSELSSPQKEDIKNLLIKYQETLRSVPGLTSIIEHKIEIAEPATFRLQHSYPLPLALEGILRKEIEKWLEMGVIEKSNSPYCSPLLAVRKKDGSHRFCLDCRHLNAQTVHDQEPIHDPTYIFSQLTEANWFSKLDLTAGYWQVPLAQDSRCLTAFRTRQGLYQFRVMPFGLVNAPATFSRLMRTVTTNLENTYCYLDDVLIATKDWASHLKALDSLLAALNLFDLRAKPSKCEIGCQQLTYLGHIIGTGISKPLPDRVQAISEAPLPKTKKELRSFLGSVGYYQRFVKNYSSLSGPLSSLTKNNQPEIIAWTDKTIDIFNALKKILTKEPILQLPNISRPFTLQTDASGNGVGAVLLQPNHRDPRILSPVAYASRLLNKAELNYSTVEKEGLAVYWALQKFQVYLYGRKFTLRTDHKPLLYLGQADKLNPRLKRWAIYIGLYQFHAEHIAGKDNFLPDFLSRATVNE